MAALAITAFVLGLAGGVTPGPVLAAAFAKIMQAGLHRSLGIILWALLIETLVGLSSLMLLASLDLPQAFFGALSIAGACVLVWIAVGLWRIQRIDPGSGTSFGPGRLAAMILTNGVLWSYWITVCVPQAIMLGALVSYGEYLFVSLVQIGWLLSTLAAAAAFARIRRLLSDARIVPWVFRSFAALFVCFAVNLAWSGAGAVAAAF